MPEQSVSRRRLEHTGTQRSPTGWRAGSPRHPTAGGRQDPGHDAAVPGRQPDDRPPATPAERAVRRVGTPGGTPGEDCGVGAAGATAGPPRGAPRPGSAAPGTCVSRSTTSQSRSPGRSFPRRGTSNVSSPFCGIGPTIGRSSSTVGTVGEASVARRRPRLSPWRWRRLAGRSRRPTVLRGAAPHALPNPRLVPRQDVLDEIRVVGMVGGVGLGALEQVQRRRSGDYATSVS